MSEAIPDAPDFLSQTAEPMPPEERRAWFSRKRAEGETAGAVRHRFSYHAEQPDILLYEGWKTTPVNEGEPNFQMVSLS